MRSKLRENENVIFKTRKHWIVLCRPLMVLVAVIAFMILAFSIELPETARDFKKLTERLSVFAIVGAIVYLIYCLYERKFNIWVVTNLRVVDEWGVLSHNAKESPLNKINNVSYKQTIIGRLLNYGSVEIQTAAEQGATVSIYVTSPKEFHRAIINAQESYQRGEGQGMNRSDPYQDEEDRVECPYCAEKIKSKAKLCRYCGKEIVKETKTERLESQSAPEVKIKEKYVSPRSFLYRK